MADDIVFRPISTKVIEQGAIIVGVNKYGSYQRIDGDDDYPLPAWSGEAPLWTRLEGRMDNKGYY